MTTFCTRDIAPVYADGRHLTWMGRHFIIDGNKVMGARYCYSWQKCPRLRAPFVDFIMPMANGEWKFDDYAGLTYEDILIKMFNVE